MDYVPERLHRWGASERLIWRIGPGSPRCRQKTSVAGRSNRHDVNLYRLTPVRCHIAPVASSRERYRPGVTERRGASGARYARRRGAQKGRASSGSMGY